MPHESPDKIDSETAVVPTSIMRSTIAAFSEAWARCDLDGLMSLMSDEPVYRTSGGLSFRGRDEVRKGFERMCQPAKSPAAQAPAADSPPGKFIFFEDKCLSYWSLALTDAGGESRVVEGVDVISFNPDGRIRMKDAYRKGT